jgi:hypothetical protein
LRTTSIPSTRPSPTISTGETQKRSRIAPLPRCGPLRILAQHLDVATRVGVVLERSLARRIELELDRIDEHVGVGELAELLQLRRRECRLCRAAAREEDDLLET